MFDLRSEKARPTPRRRIPRREGASFAEKVAHHLGGKGTASAGGGAGAGAGEGGAGRGGAGQAARCAKADSYRQTLAAVARFSDSALP
ncbi:hypothetical protein GCM10022240_09280 [Microbacterium kribbense]|uniref:Uncharacterized protein n=1 Tax=Microbacterium kribbense TaxID=433645 RepID=A0ABP7G802_9MICO